MIVRPLESDEAWACDAIIAGLPDFFGLESGIQACAEAVRGPFRGCAEISWMAVERAHHGAGIDEYEPTRGFYRARGFMPATTFPGWWEGDLPLLPVRPL